jgi:hypothetical protein
MSHRIRKAITLVAGALLVAGVASAGAPDRSQSTWVQNGTAGSSLNATVGIGLGGSDGTGGPGPNTIDVKSEIVITVRDIANPIPGAMVTLDFSGCPQIGISNTLYSIYPSAGAIPPCGGGPVGLAGPASVSAVAGTDGVVKFRLSGKVSGVSEDFPTAPPDGGPTYRGCGTATITASGFQSVVIPFIVSAFDHNGGGGVDGGDLSLALGDRFANNYRERSDYDVAGTPGAVTGGDLSVAIGIRFGGGSTVSIPTTCP